MTKRQDDKKDKKKAEIQFLIYRKYFKCKWSINLIVNIYVKIYALFKLL